MRRDSRLNAEDRRQAAHQLSELVTTKAGGITSKGGGSGKRGLFVSDYVPLQGVGRRLASPSRWSGPWGGECHSSQLSSAAQSMTDQRVRAVWSGEEECATGRAVPASLGWHLRPV